MRSAYSIENAADNASVHRFLSYRRRRVLFSLGQIHSVTSIRRSIRFPLDGPVEQPYPQSKPTALFWGVLVLMVAFVVYQVAGFVALVALSALQGVSLERLLIEVQQGIMARPSALLGANSIGQVVGLGLVAWLAARMHTSQPDAFLRVRTKPSVRFSMVSIGIVMCLIPVVQVVGEWNASLPLPDVLRDFEASQLELMERVLSSSQGIGINLVLLALTPALFEELMFRGYFQRQAERATGPGWGVFLSGVIFGLYHMRASQVVALSLLGCFLAYAVWRTRSVWTGVIVHFVYNGSLVVLAGVVDDPLDVLDLPGYAFWLGLIGAGALTFWLHHATASESATIGDAEPRTLAPH